MVKLSKEQLDKKLEYINNYIQSENAADGSKMDANANVSNKNVATLSSEIHKDINIQINRRLIYDKLVELYDVDIANEYIRQLESHEIYTHDETNPFMPYCASISLYPFLLEGLKGVGGESSKPEHLSSFNGGLINLIFAISSQFAGAIATVEWLNYFDYFARKDYGDDYLDTYTKEVEQQFQQVVYSINQPASARGFQAVFWNISIFDKEYFNEMFENFYFPDGTKSNWNTLDKLQKYFMKWFNKERTNALLTFPVVTASCLNDGKTLKDEDFQNFISEELSEGNSFFIFTSDKAHALSSCCFSKEQKCLTKSSNGVNYMTFEELFNSKHRDRKKNLTIYHNGNWVKGKEIKLPKRKMYKIETANNKKIVVSDNHLNVTLRGDVETKNLNNNDYLMFNTNILAHVPEKDENLTYDEGLIIGMFLGDGSFGSRINNQIYDINFSMNKDTYKLVMETLNKVSKNKSNLSNIHNNVYPVRISDKKLVSFIQKWTNWKEGTKAHNKELNLDCLLQRFEFRKGILDGWYHTDGGNSNRCYTTSEKLSEHMETLITSLGMQSIIDVSDRINEKLVIRNQEYNRNYPLFCVRFYDSEESNQKRTMKDVYITKNNSKYFKIKNIEEIYYDDDIYCFEMYNENEPYFTLPNGIITHNCRLKNDVSDIKDDFSYSLGAGGVQTGSLNVITLNINRLVQDGRDIVKEVEKIHKYQTAFRSYFEDLKKDGMLPIYDAGYINMDKQYLTVGVNGIVEAAEYLGFEINNNIKYKEWVSGLLKKISDTNTEGNKKYGYRFNTEFVPAENLGVKFAKWDKEDGYEVMRNQYNSYLYKVEDDGVSVLDKFSMHGKDTSQYLDGGSAYHCNLENYPTKEGFKKLLNVAVKEGTEYFTFNVKVTGCNSCGFIDKRTNYKCSKCGSKDIYHATRVIGYLKKVEDFSSERQEEEKMRYYSKV